jgi:hypothetical protein
MVVLYTNSNSHIFEVDNDKLLIRVIKAGSRGDIYK